MAGEIGRVIKRLREQSRKRQSDLSKDCNVKQPNLSRIEKGRCEPRHATLARIAEALGTTVEAVEAEAAKLAAMTTWPLPRPGVSDESGGAGGAGARTMTVPVFDTSAGYGLEFDSSGRPAGLGDLVVQLPLVDVPCFACRVCGDSMAPRAGEGFAPGDILVFAQRPPRSGDLAFVRVRGAAVFRQVFFEAGEVRLVPLNRAYEENRVSSRDVVQMWKLVQHLRFFD